MARLLSLAHLTCVTLPPPELISVAARAGFDAVGLRLIAVTPTSPGYPLWQDAALMRETKRRMADTGVRVNDIEFLRLTPETDVAALEPFVAAGAELGARTVLTAPYDPDLSRLAGTLGAVGDLAAQYGMGAVLEFFPWTEIADVGAAVRVAQAAGRDNVGVLVDTLHFARSGDPLDALRAAPASLLPFVHLCDCPAEKPDTLEGLLHHGRAERLPPGEGGLALTAMLDALPADVPIGCEVPMEQYTREAGVEAVARRVAVGARRVLAGVTGRRS